MTWKAPGPSLVPTARTLHPSVPRAPVPRLELWGQPRGTTGASGCRGMDVCIVAYYNFLPVGDAWWSDDGVKCTQKNGKRNKLVFYFPV